MKKAVIVGLAVFVCIGGVLFWIQRTQLEAERDKVRDLSGQLESLREEAARAAKAQTDSPEVKRLREEQSELARLRNEVTQLRRQVKDATAVKAKASAAPPTPEPSEETPLAMQYKSFEATNRVVIRWKQTLVTGGWATPTGGRILVFSRPQTLAQPRKGGQILFEGKVLEVPEEIMAQVGFPAGFPQGDNQNPAQALLSAEEAERIGKQLENSEGVKTLSSPKVMTNDGAPASIALGQNLPLPSGEQVFRGTTIELAPQISDDGASVDLTVISHMDIPNKASD